MNSLFQNTSCPQGGSVALLLHSSPGIFLVCLLLVLRAIVSGFLPQSKYVQINWWLSSVCRYKWAAVGFSVSALWMMSQAHCRFLPQCSLPLFFNISFIESSPLLHPSCTVVSTGKLTNYKIFWAVLKDRAVFNMLTVTMIVVQWRLII